jgi:hypothetical protein
MQKFSIKYWQTKFNNILKIFYIVIKLASFQGCRIVQHIQINKCNTAYKQKQGQKNHMNITIDTEKAFDNTHHPFMLKALEKKGIEGMYLNIRKAIYNKSAGIIRNGEKLKPFPLSQE